jgi:carboxyl-terminal processing protease
MTMTGWLDPLRISSGVESFSSLVIASSAKAGLVLAAGALAALVLRRGSAASRHLAWSVAAVAALGLPLLSAALPGWRTALAIPWPLRTETASRPVVPPRSQPTDVTLSESLTSRGNEVASLAPTPPWQTDRPFRRTFTVQRHDSPTRPIPQDSEVPLITRGFSMVWKPSWALCAWVVGVFLSSVPVLLGMLSLRRVARAAVPVTDPATLRLVDRLVTRVGVRRPVRLVLSASREIPMTWGILHPAILLPADAGRWPEDRLTTALLHELAHIRRWDFLTQLAARAACALYWFNPLAWLALTRMHREQEQAADDVALGCGLDRYAYAGHLLAIVTRRPLNGPRAAIAPAMASSEKLERRLRVILDAGRSRREPGRRAVGLVAASALAFILPLAALNPWGESLASAAMTGITPAVQPPGGATPVPKIDEVAVESEVLAKVREVYIKPPDESALRKGAIRGMLDALQDPHSEYIDAQHMADLTRNTQGKITGIGAQLQSRDGQVIVVTPLFDSPALKAGIRAGDVIDEVDGKPTRGLELAEVVKRIIGKEGEAVRLKVSHADGRAEELAVTRGVVKVPSISGFRLAVDHWEFLLDPDHAIGYIHINQFGAETPGELKKAIEGLTGRGMKALILDLRGCPGGLLSAAIDVARMFLAKGTIVTVRGRGQAVQSFTAEAQPALAADVPFVVLIDGATASAAEILAGSLKDNDRAILLGSRTFGKGSIQTIVRLKDDGGAIKLTTAYYQLPRGEDIDKRDGKSDWGVDPTDGYYVPVDSRTLDALIRNRLERDRVGVAAGAAKVTPESIERDAADPSLAAALKTLIARTTGGEFVRSGLPVAEQTARLKRLDEARKRRQSLLEDLKKVEKDLKELGQGTAERP